MTSPRLQRLCSVVSREDVSLTRQIVILCGGLGSRLGHLTDAIPKSMISINNVPFLEILIKQLIGQGFDNFLLLTGYKGDVIQNYFRDGSNLSVSIVYSQEPQPLGTGGAIKLARPKIHERFWLLYGDIYRNFNYYSMDKLDSNYLGVYEYSQGLSTIRSPNISLDFVNNLIEGYKKDNNDMNYRYVDAGFGLFTKDTIDLLPSGVSNWESTVYPILAEGSNLRPLIVDRDFYDIGNLEDLQKTRLKLLL